MLATIGVNRPIKTRSIKGCTHAARSDAAQPTETLGVAAIQGQDYGKPQQAKSLAAVLQHADVSGEMHTYLRLRRETVMCLLSQVMFCLNHSLYNSCNNERTLQDFMHVSSLTEWPYEHLQTSI